MLHQFGNSCYHMEKIGDMGGGGGCLGEEMSRGKYLGNNDCGEMSGEERGMSESQKSIFIY